MLKIALVAFLVLCVADARQIQRRSYKFGGESGASSANEGSANRGSVGESSAGEGTSGRGKGFSSAAPLLKGDESHKSAHKLNLGLGVGVGLNALKTHFTKQQVEGGNGKTYDLTYNFPAKTATKPMLLPALNLSYQFDAFRFLGFRVGAWATYTSLSRNETSKNITVAEVNRDGIFVGVNNQINAGGNGMLNGSASMVFEPFAKPIVSKMSLTHLNVNLHFDALLNLLVWRNYTLGGVLGLEAGFSDIKTSVENSYQFTNHQNDASVNVAGNSSHKFAHKIVHYNLTVALRNVIANAHAIELGARIPFGLVAKSTAGASHNYEWGTADKYPITNTQSYTYKYKPSAIIFLNYIFSFSL